MPLPGQSATALPDIAAQVSGQPPAAPVPGPALPPEMMSALAQGIQGGLPQGPGMGAPGGGLSPGQMDPQMLIAATQADQLFQQQYGTSFFDLQQTGQSTPELEAAFGELMDQIVREGPNAEQELGLNVPGGIV